MRRLFAVPKKCNGCRICELVCSNRIFPDACNPRYALLRIEDRSLDKDVPVVCRECPSPGCKEACTRGAFYRDEVTGALKIDPTLCDNCGDCVRGCPFDVMVEPFSMNVPLKCDFCDGDPLCVKFCPTGALEFLDRG